MYCVGNSKHVEIIRLISVLSLFHNIDQLDDYAEHKWNANYTVIVQLFISHKSVERIKYVTILINHLTKKIPPLLIIFF